MDFSDRFLVATPSLIGVDIPSLTSEQLEALAPSVRDFANMTRTHSALIRSKSAKEIYSIVTEQVDPRIALILAAARDGAGARIFPNLDAVKQVMFGQTDPTETAYVNPERNIFTQGVRRVAAAMTAAILVGQLAQIEEQANHSKILEERAISDLDRMLRVPDLAAAAEQKLSVEDETKSFYFQPFEMELGTRILKAEFFMVSSAVTSWQTINNYTGKFTTAQIVADLADAINSYTLVQQTSNLISAPVLGDESSFYKLEFKARKRDVTVSCEVISVRFNFTDNPREALPFKWGTSPAGLSNQFINSLLLAVQQGRTASAAVTGSDRNTGDPTVLYFKRAPVNSNGDVLDWEGDVINQTLWAAQGNLTFRISPTMTENKTVSVPFLSNSDPEQQSKLDALRPNQTAELLLNELFEIKGDTLALGALIRNDYPDSPNALVAMELIAFSVTNPQAWLILDLLELPADVLVAVGNLVAPLTPFSSKPRSIRVESKFFAGVSSSLRQTTQDVKVTPKVVKAPISDRLQAVRDHDSYRVND